MGKIVDELVRAVLYHWTLTLYDVHTRYDTIYPTPGWPRRENSEAWNTTLRTIPYYRTYKAMTTGRNRLWLASFNSREIGV